MTKLGSSGMAGGEGARPNQSCLEVRAGGNGGSVLGGGTVQVSATKHIITNSQEQNNRRERGPSHRRDARLATKPHTRIEEEGVPILLRRKAGGGTIGLVDLIAPCDCARPVQALVTRIWPLPRHRGTSAVSAFGKVLEGLDQIPVGLEAREGQGR